MHWGGRGPSPHCAINENPFFVHFIEFHGRKTRRKIDEFLLTYSNTD